MSAFDRLAERVEQLDGQLREALARLQESSTSIAALKSLTQRQRREIAQLQGRLTRLSNER